MKFRSVIVTVFAALPLTKGMAQSETPSVLSTFADYHCVSCHSGDDPDGGFNFSKLAFDLANEETARRWVLVHDRVAWGEMPPSSEARPDASQSAAFVTTLADAMRTAEANRNDVVLRRLNRHEYENTVRDLFQTDVSVNGLPEDSSTDGFDTVGEGLAVSAEAMTAYLEAADQVLDAVFGTSDKPKHIRHETNLLKQVDWKGRPQLDNQIGKMFRRTDDGLVIFQSGYCPTNLVNFARLRAPAGTYRGTLRVRAIQSDKPVTLRIYGGDTIVNRGERHLVGYFDVPPGEWTTIEFTDRLVEDGGTYQPKCYGTRDTRKDADTWPEPGIEIGDIVIEGPIDAWPPPSRAYLLGNVDPQTASEDDARTNSSAVVATRISTTCPVGRSGYLFETYLRRPPPVAVPSISALRVSLKAILCSPEFLFLNEPGTSQISQHALAARLSYFLWSSMPDEELTTLANNGRCEVGRAS